MTTTNGTRVLIGYDGSDGALAAMEGLRHAGLPSEVGALVITVADVGPIVPAAAEHGLSDPSARSVEASRRIVAAAALQAERTAAQGAEVLRRLMPGWRVAHAGRHGSPSRTLVEQAQLWQADLLVVGSHGRSPIGRLVLGSVSHFVAEHAGCSVRVGRDAREGRARARGGVRILLGIDGSDGASAAVEVVAARTWPAGTEVRLIVVVDLALCASLGRRASLGWLIRGGGADASTVEWPDWPRRLIAPAAQALADAGLETSSDVLGGDAKHVLVEEADRWDADCIFLGATGHAAGERFPLGGVSSAVASRAPCPVELVRQGRGKRDSTAGEPAGTHESPTLRTREVVGHEWPAFADHFSRLHKGQLVTVETFAPDLGAQSNVRDTPLMGITVERREYGGWRLVILAGDSPHTHLAHVVDAVSHVRVAVWNDAVSSALQIESADGRVTLLQVGPAGQMLPPGFVTDGVFTPAPAAARVT